MSVFTGSVHKAGGRFVSSQRLEEGAGLLQKGIREIELPAVAGRVVRPAPQQEQRPLRLAERLISHAFSPAQRRLPREAPQP